MKKLDRRQWLRTAGMGSALTLLSSPAALAGNMPLKDPYRPLGQKVDDLVRLSSNENPYGPSPKVRKALTEAFDLACRYPFGYEQKLREALSEKHGVPADHIMIAAGSTEGLKVTGMVYGGDGEVIAAEPTYLSLLNYAEDVGGYIHMVPVDDQMGHDLEEMEKRITAKTGLVFVCNPNNPTGTLLPAQKMRDFCHSVSNKTMVFADEAYFDYITEPDYPSMVELVKEGANVIVSRTFSKVFGLAGIRIGYLIARPDIIDRLQSLRMAGPSVLAIFAALEALKDKEFYQYSLDQNMQGKKVIYQALKDLNLEYVPSHSNFVFFHSGQEIGKLNAAMRQEGVLVGRPFPPFTDWCRISTGTVEETEKFAMALKKVMKA
ncbi:pyridoxal phosphate-dependent aminotransferase [Flavilitoribacter nigricans]|uniref:Aminotransferase n=1 Tax=Flavilitoribacter nigricans (strain ATCC 23147 / DSM 23189 / NBRC 102662 / NCIMB 1420 / SS-2) TaxID=1122177 RepID=A0A2D0NA14_FLAN2|nr:histidinol-phosphate transaminase [Flavilitoribacter nigricans]PHN05325.1 aminotransferase [Flavilitoribacter nigricans DSM 23189 = NBRC 102662]